MLRFQRLPSTVLAMALWILVTAVSSHAGTTGKLTGRVLDGGGDPVVAATVQVGGTRLGAYANADGVFTILNVPPGTYEVSVSRIGFRSTLITDVVVSADQTTTVNAELLDEAVQTEEVVVMAARPPVDVNLTSSQVSIPSEEIEELPVQDLQDVVNLQAGVVDGHFRGGRTGEVQYQVDGVSVNNSYDNTSSLRLDRSLLQEVQVISGTFDAEYGQAMSGVVNAILKEGGEEFEWSGEAFTGGFVFPESEDERRTENLGGLDGVQNYQLTVNGPTPLDNTTFLASARRYVYDDWLYGERRFVPTDTSDTQNDIFEGTGDGEKVALGFSREWSGVFKVTNRSIPNAKVGYQAIINKVNSRRSDFAFRFNPDGLSEQETFSISHGFDWSQTLTDRSFLNLSLRQNYFRYEDFVYEDLFDPRYDEAGPPVSDSAYELGAVVQGVEFTQFVQRTNAFLIETDYTNQVDQHHLIKGGMEIQLPEVEFGSPGYLTFTVEDGEEKLVRKRNEPPDFPGPQTHHPLFGAAYIQDRMEWDDLKVRAGLRCEYFDARSTLPSDLANPANSIDGAPESVPTSTDAKVIFAPRLGVAHPITDRGALHFAYGHFYQFPSIGTIFTNSDYSVLDGLQASTVRYGVMGNPDVKPEKTVQYELGYKHALSDDLGLDFTAFYKDIRDLLGVEFVSTYNDAEYARLTNVDFGDVLGFTLAVDHRAFGPFSVALDYTWQIAQGNSSDPRETATRAEAGEDARPRLLPFNWDQRQTMNLTTVLRGQSYSASAVVRAASGQPYTPISEAVFGGALDPQSGRKSGGVLLDLRAERSLGGLPGRASLFGRIFNVFDTRSFNGFVFSSTGSADYTRFPVAEAAQLANPTRFYGPRRVEVGISLRSEAR